MVAAALVGILHPPSSFLALIALVFFGLVMLYGCFLAWRLLGAWDLAIKDLLGQQSALEVECDRHRNALDELADGLAIVIFLTDRTGKILYANRAAQDAFGLGEPSGLAILGVTISQEVNEMVLQAASGQPARRELVLRHPRDRSYVVGTWQEASVEGRVFISMVDISELRYLERVRRDFVANVSHELRTPMTTIRAMAETLQDDDPEDQELRPRYLSKIVREVDRLTTITDDLLILSTVEASNLQKSEVDLAELLRVCVQQLVPLATEKGLVLGYQGPYCVKGMFNGDQMTQVFLNLIQNAVNYTGRGTISVRLMDRDDDILVEVEDTGIGISADQATRVFERFYRVDKGRSRASGGTGLGLSIVRNIVEAHGGRVSLESELNRGSTFRVSLPKT